MELGPVPNLSLRLPTRWPLHSQPRQFQLCRYAIPPPHPYPRLQTSAPAAPRSWDTVPDCPSGLTAINRTFSVAVLTRGQTRLALPAMGSQGCLPVPVPVPTTAPKLVLVGPGQERDRVAPPCVLHRGPSPAQRPSPKCPLRRCLHSDPGCPLPGCPGGCGGSVESPPPRMAPPTSGCTAPRTRGTRSWRGPREQGDGFRAPRPSLLPASPPRRLPAPLAQPPNPQPIDDASSQGPRRLSTYPTHHPARSSRPLRASAHSTDEGPRPRVSPPPRRTHFICRVRLRCRGVLLLTGMW